MVSGSGKIVQRATTEEPKKENLRPPAGKAKSSSPRPKPALTIDTKCAEEASTRVTILMPKGTETDGGEHGWRLFFGRREPAGGLSYRHFIHFVAL